MPPLDIVTVTAYVPQGYIIATAVALPDDLPKRRKRKPKVSRFTKPEPSILCWASDGEFADDDDAGGVTYTYANTNMPPLVEAMA